MLGSGIYDIIYAMVNNWPSRSHLDEDAYRDDLYRYLRTKVHNHAVNKNAGSSRADIGIGTKVAIELKYNFNSPAKVRDLFGHVADHIDSFSEGVICVLCGPADEKDILDFREMVNGRLSRNSSTFSSQDRVRIVRKP